MKMTSILDLFRQVVGALAASWANEMMKMSGGGK